MGHAIFIVLHLVMVFFAMWGLVFTIPMHLIYGVITARSSQAAKADDGQHVRCPECRELVRADARKCKHCGAALDPEQQLQSLAKKRHEDAKNLAIGIGAIAALVLLASTCS